MLGADNMVCAEIPSLKVVEMPTTIVLHNTAQVGMPLQEESVDGNAFSSLVSANFFALE